MTTRPGLNPAQIIGAAADLADRVGLYQFTLKELAEQLGVRTPSLYNHVASLEAVQRGLRLRAVQELTARVQQAAVGRSGLEGLRAVAAAERDFARQRPGLFAAMQRTFEGEDEELKAASRTLLGIVLAVLRSYGLEGEQGIHAARALRASLTGFVGLEAQQGFGLAADVEQSFEWLISVLDAGLRTMAATQTGA
ncbi:WHG domain-containing protein [Deinococcus sp. KNUC1210]|uniref:TetR/AcrR family transcriptional regulator n=1 Tax=Deinococcus sp. KNUC1210 TaxID=2917691 RepID=UPI001EEF924C|nr:TetR-like C-terminal domain-containing protein [Deinococcus sp. KNUC1210]ULH16426.1 WHG domain-containing protein [Deinococcus sp. KNUC1210]